MSYCWMFELASAHGMSGSDSNRMDERKFVDGNYYSFISSNLY